MQVMKFPTFWEYDPCLWLLGTDQEQGGGGDIREEGELGSIRP